MLTVAFLFRFRMLSVSCRSLTNQRIIRGLVYSVRDTHSGIANAQECDLYLEHSASVDRGSAALSPFPFLLSTNLLAFLFVALGSHFAVALNRSLLLTLSLSLQRASSILAAVQLPFPSDILLAPEAMLLCG